MAMERTYPQVFSKFAMRCGNSVWGTGDERMLPNATKSSQSGNDRQHSCASGSLLAKIRKECEQKSGIARRQAGHEGRTYPYSTFRSIISLVAVK